MLRKILHIAVLLTLLCCSGNDYYTVEKVIDGNKIQLDNGLTVVLEEVANNPSNLSKLESEILSRKILLYDKHMEEITSFQGGVTRAYVYDMNGKCLNDLFKSTTNVVTPPPPREQNKDIVIEDRSDDLPGSTLSELYRELKKAVFMVVISSDTIVAQGSGFFISPKGLAVSNYHVFENAGNRSEISIILDSREFEIGSIIESDEENDYIIFEVDNRGFSLPFLRFTGNIPAVGEDIFCIGNPYGLEHTLSTGIISGMRDEQRLIQITAEITHGSSGGPLFNQAGVVIGITTAGIGTANLNFAVNINLLNLARFIDLSVNDSPTGSTVFVERVIDGDTFVIDGGERIRLIGVDTPEIHRNKESKDYLGREAYLYVKNLIEGKQVRLELDAQKRDRYGRILAYVYRNNLFLNADLISKGYARIATYPPNVKHVDEFVALQEKARDDGVGVWEEAM